MYKFTAAFQKTPKTQSTVLTSANIVLCHKLKLIFDKLFLDLNVIVDVHEPTSYCIV